MRRQIERFPNEYDLGFANCDLANHRPDCKKSEPGNHVHEFDRHHLAPLICVDSALPCREPSIRGFSKIIGQQVGSGKAFRQRPYDTHSPSFHQNHQRLLSPGDPEKKRLKSRATACGTTTPGKHEWPLASHEKHGNHRLCGIWKNLLQVNSAVRQGSSLSGNGIRQVLLLERRLRYTCPTAGS
ncbi:MAG: hypothetical protein CMJ81_00030 [Planctomycetaceae bacterium]|nr:hypothetical protein [Planctomycetaceae bacterium]MBP60162.1 hypothetical protein [Planctomycetaceae bacterium]